MDLNITDVTDESVRKDPIGFWPVEGGYVTLGWGHYFDQLPSWNTCWGRILLNNIGGGL